METDQKIYEDDPRAIADCLEDSVEHLEEILSTSEMENIIFYSSQK